MDRPRIEVHFTKGPTPDDIGGLSSRGNTCRLDFDEVDDLRSVDLERLRAEGRSIRRLVLVEAGKVVELPEPSEAFREARAIDLDPLLATFPEIRELYVDPNPFPLRDTPFSRAGC